MWLCMFNIYWENGFSCAKISHSSCIKAWQMIPCQFLLTSFLLNHVKYFFNYEADFIYQEF